jgi:hypothetical protein
MTLALVCVVVAAAGCGVPGSGEPVTLDDAPGVGGPVGPAGSVQLPEPTPPTTPVELVKRFLRVGAAADWDPAVRPDDRILTAVRQARRFLDQTGMATWKPGDSINVVEMIEEPKATVDFTVTVKLRKVGVLDEKGTLTPSGDPQIKEYPFKVAPPTDDTGPALFSSVPDSMLPLSLEGLRDLFEVRPVYYWEPTERFLVPDRRYLSRGISAEKRVKTIVERVLAGPSEFLTQPPQAVLPPPVNKPLDNATLTGNTVAVNLPVLGETDLEKPMARLATQLRWSLHPGQYTVELRTDGRDRRTYTGTDYLRFNPSQAMDGRNESRLFGAVNGNLRPLDPGVSKPSILTLPENSNVVAAALNVRQNSAALVRQVDGRRTLYVVRTPADRSAVQFVAADLPDQVGPFSRPSYLPGAGDRVLVVAGGNLYDVDLGSGKATMVSLPPPLTPGSLVAVSVAPEGARIAMVTASRAYVATIDPSKLPATVGPGSGQPIRELYARNLSDLRGVGWSNEDQLVIGGRSGLIATAIDGSHDPAVQPTLLTAALTQVAAVPRNPAGNTGYGDVVIEVSTSGVGQSYSAFQSDIRDLKAPPVPGASPSPSASASAPPQEPRVTAPFYADVV